ncbi:MAG: GTP pyrophosphokinase [Candidatus Eiseniibacteriota bacterium]|jgi:(p)ppGpp synthase/HD superfamily hydrolase
MTPASTRALIERALAVALDAHSGQTGKGGEAKILHPLRMMARAADDDERIVAILHDVIEGSSWTPAGLRREGFDERLVVAVDALSRRHGEDYDAYIERAAAVPLARRVKILDAEDNRRRALEVIEAAERAGETSTEAAALRGKLGRYARALERLRGR